VVNLSGDMVSDVYVLPREKVVDYRSNESGIESVNMTNAIAIDKVTEFVKELFKNKTIVGYDLTTLMVALGLPQDSLRMRVD